MKDMVLLLAKQMVGLKAAMNQREEITPSSSEDPFGSLPGDQFWSWKRARTPFQPFREAS